MYLAYLFVYLCMDFSGYLKIFMTCVSSVGKKGFFLLLSFCLFSFLYNVEKEFLFFWTQQKKKGGKIFLFKRKSSKLLWLNILLLSFCSFFSGGQKSFWILFGARKIFWSNFLVEYFLKLPAGDQLFCNSTNFSKNSISRPKVSQCLLRSPNFNQ